MDKPYIIRRKKYVRGRLVESKAIGEAVDAHETEAMLTFLLIDMDRLQIEAMLSIMFMSNVTYGSVLAKQFKRTAPKTFIQYVLELSEAVPF